MPTLAVPLISNKFSVKLSIDKVGTGNRQHSEEVEAVLDTGATHSCISYSFVQRLQIPPSGEFAATTTASGMVFNRGYPVRIGVNGVIFKIIPALVLFHPEHFLNVEAPVPGEVPFSEIQKICHTEGLQVPKTLFQRQENAPTGNGRYLTHIYRPGIGAEQNPILVGMDFLQNYNWEYSRADKRLVLHY